jgi:hypothetical protein
MVTPVYLAILAINAGIYLWVPGWAGRFGLLQVYIIPAALTVLLLLHVHRHELQPNALFGGRLTNRVLSARHNPKNTRHRHDAERALRIRSVELNRRTQPPGLWGLYPSPEGYA